jgi:hypothetical protein
MTSAGFQVLSSLLGYSSFYTIFDDFDDFMEALNFFLDKPINKYACLRIFPYLELFLF